MMKFLASITNEEKDWLYAEIDKASQATPEQRLRFLSSMKRLYLRGVEQRNQRGEPEIPLSELDQIVQRISREYSAVPVTYDR